MINAQFVPIENWPGKQRTSWKSAPFRVTYPRRLDKLEDELNKLGAKDILIQCYLGRDDLRNDGWPKSQARPVNPGIIISFTNAGGDQLSFPCDSYDDWYDNLYAIALSLEALRAVDRYGVTRSSEQYQGWRRLGPSPQSEVKTEDCADRRFYRERWAFDHLARVAQLDPRALRDRAAVELAFRLAVKKTHPDTGGNPEAFRLVNEAMRVIREVMP